jgi:hypothetical protein
VTKTLGKKAENPSCPSVYRDELCPRRFRLFTEVLVQSFAGSRFAPVCSAFAAHHHRSNGSLPESCFWFVCNI